MLNFVIIKKILVYLMKAMDQEEVDMDDLVKEIEDVSESRRASIFRIMSKAGLIEGINVLRTYDGEVYMEVDNPTITLKGLEYLYGSDFMLMVENRKEEVPEE